MATESADLARLATKTGELGEWTTPPNHSMAMERLIHRTTNVLEAFLGLFEEDAYLPLLAEVWRMIVQDKATATDIHAAIFQWATKDKKLHAALGLRPVAAAAAAATKKEGATS